MYSIKERVTPSRTGSDGKLKYVSAVDLLQDCSILWLESETEFGNYLIQNDYNLLIMYRQIDFVRRPDYDENITVAASVYENAPFAGFRNTCIYDEIGNPCVMSWLLGVFADLKKNRLIRVDKAVASNVVIDPKADMEYTGRTIKLPESGYNSLPPVPVRKNDIDRHKHVNNARYIETAIELLPEDTEIKRIRIEYKNAAKFADTFYPKITKVNDSYFIKFENESGIPYIVAEIVSL